MRIFDSNFVEERLITLKSAHNYFILRKYKILSIIKLIKKLLFAWIFTPLSAGTRACRNNRFLKVKLNNLNHCISLIDKI